MAWLPLVGIPVAAYAAEAGGAPAGDALRIVDRLPLARSHHRKLAGSSLEGLDVYWRTDRGYIVAKPRGVLNAAAAPALREFLLRLVQESAGRLVIDLSSVTRPDASGLSVLIGTGRRANLLGGLLRLAAPGSEVATLLRTTGLDQQLRVYHSVEAAVSGIGSR